MLAPNLRVLKKRMIGNAEIGDYTFAVQIAKEGAGTAAVMGKPGGVEDFIKYAETYAEKGHLQPPYTDGEKENLARRAWSEFDRDGD